VTSYFCFRKPVALADPALPPVLILEAVESEISTWLRSACRGLTRYVAGVVAEQPAPTGTMSGPAEAVARAVLCGCLDRFGRSSPRREIFFVGQAVAEGADERDDVFGRRAGAHVLDMT
jgi:hypothetical protein